MGPEPFRHQLHGYHGDRRLPCAASAIQAGIPPAIGKSLRCRLAMVEERLFTEASSFERVRFWPRALLVYQSRSRVAANHSLLWEDCECALAFHCCDEVRRREHVRRGAGTTNCCT